MQLSGRSEKLNTHLPLNGKLSVNRIRRQSYGISSKPTTCFVSANVTRKSLGNGNGNLAHGVNQIDIYRVKVKLGLWFLVRGSFGNRHEITRNVYFLICQVNEGLGEHLLKLARMAHVKRFVRGPNGGSNQLNVANNTETPKQCR